MQWWAGTPTPIRTERITGPAAMPRPFPMHTPARGSPAPASPGTLLAALMSAAPAGKDHGKKSMLLRELRSLAFQNRQCHHKINSPPCARAGIKWQPCCSFSSGLGPASGPDPSQANYNVHSFRDRHHGKTHLLHQQAPLLCGRPALGVGAHLAAGPRPADAHHDAQACGHTQRGMERPL